MSPAPASVQLEIAVDDLDGAWAAVRAGADRLELCAALHDGGLTPPLRLLADVKASVAVPVFVMVRPRPGDFVHRPDEVASMHRDLAAVRAHGADGFVLGALTPQLVVDAETIRALVAAAAPLPVTFHRAFDAIADQLAGLDTLAALGCARVLTAGGPGSAAAGAARLRALVDHAGHRIGVLAGGGVRAATLAAVLATGVREVHAGPRRSATTATQPGDATPTTTDEDEVRALVNLLRQR